MKSQVERYEQAVGPQEALAHVRSSIKMHTEEIWPRLRRYIWAMRGTALFTLVVAIDSFMRMLDTDEKQQAVLMTTCFMINVGTTVFIVMKTEKTLLEYHTELANMKNIEKSINDHLEREATP